MINLRKYIGIPYGKGACGWEGSNCWGLVCIFYEAEYGILLPRLEEEENKGPATISRLIREQAEKQWEPTSCPEFGDVIVFNIVGDPRHIAIYLNPVEMLHVEKGKDACIEQYTDLNWENIFEGFYKYVG